MLRGNAMTTATPSSKEQLADRVGLCIDNNDIPLALATCQKLTSEFPDYAYGWYLASFLLKKQGRYAEALTAIDRALLHAWSDKYQLHKARCLFEADDIVAAAAAVVPLRDSSFSDARSHNELGALLHLLKDYPNALQHYAKAIARSGSNAEFHFNKAAVQRYLGDAAGAEAGFETAIALNPHEFEAYNARAQVRKQTQERNHVRQLQEVLQRTTAPAGLTQLHYALAKELEDLGEHADSFRHLKLGADTRRKHMQYSVATDLQIMAAIRAAYRQEMFDGHVQGCADPAPIFIIGMPRTGTTLVQRILGSHSSVYSAGELSTFSLELTRLARQTLVPAPRSRTDFVARTVHLDFRALGEAYIEKTRPMRDASPRFIDKLPFNYLYAGLIHLALPQAKIINIQRHPMDTCYAVYKQLFKDAYPFSYDLNELGQYYIDYHRLMQHWNEVMPGVLHTLRYEAVVADVEGEARRLLQFCGLAWEDQCLRFYEDTQASTTASALQVRQPVYASSVGRWRHYAQQLEPLRLQLENAGIACA
jgi:tetratricopeptide (TPR) repeat protein